LVFSNVYLKIIHSDGQKMKDEKTNNESQNTTPKTKIGQHEPH
jgi:hypothetical protein